LEELKLDYEDYLRQRGLALWREDDPRRRALVARRCRTAEEVAAWVREMHESHGRDGPGGRYGPGKPTERRGGVDSASGSMPSISSIRSISANYPEIAANAAHVLIGVACALLDRQIEALAAAFAREGGFTERLHRVRTQR
jgi:four helix bundle suffix protein